MKNNNTFRRGAIAPPAVDSTAVCQELVALLFALAVIDDDHEARERVERLIPNREPSMDFLRTAVGAVVSWCPHTRAASVRTNAVIDLVAFADLKERIERGTL